MAQRAGHTQGALNMAHYAFLDSNNVVTEVIVGRDEGTLGIDWEQFYASERGQPCVRTSYSASIRKNYAGIGYSYNPTLDAFIPPQPYPSWQLDTTTCQWLPPQPYPSDGAMYTWNESSISWQALTT